MAWPMAFGTGILSGFSESTEHPSAERWTNNHEFMKVNAIYRCGQNNCDVYLTYPTL